MKQSFFDMILSTKKARKGEFLEQMELVVPWKALVEMITPFYLEVRTGRPPFSLDAMLRTHVRQQWFTLSDMSVLNIRRKLP